MVRIGDAKLLADWQFADVNTAITPQYKPVQQPVQFAAADMAVNGYRPAVQQPVQKAVQFADAGDSAKQRKAANAANASAQLYLMALEFGKPDPFATIDTGGMSGFGIAGSRFIGFA